MPRYLLEAGVDGSAELRAVVDLATSRFPEIAVEHCYTDHDGVDVTTFWVCKAPSEAHVRRWAAAAQLSTASLRRVDAVEIAGADGAVSTKSRNSLNKGLEA